MPSYKILAGHKYNILQYKVSDENFTIEVATGRMRESYVVQDTAELSQG